MKFAALISLFSMIAAAVAGIILLIVRMRKANKADRRSLGMIALFAFLIAVMILNFFVVLLPLL